MYAGRLLATSFPLMSTKRVGNVGVKGRVASWPVCEMNDVNVCIKRTYLDLCMQLYIGPLVKKANEIKCICQDRCRRSIFCEQRNQEHKMGKQERYSEKDGVDYER